MAPVVRWPSSVLVEQEDLGSITALSLGTRWLEFQRNLTGKNDVQRRREKIVAVPFVGKLTWRLKKLSQRYPNILRVQKTFFILMRGFQGFQFVLCTFWTRRKGGEQKSFESRVTPSWAEISPFCESSSGARKVLSSKTVFTKVHGPNRWKVCLCYSNKLFHTYSRLINVFNYGIFFRGFNGSILTKLGKYH